MPGEITGLLSMSIARACSWTRSLSSKACCCRFHSRFQSLEKTQPITHMSTVMARQVGPRICRGICCRRSMPVLLNPKTVMSTPTMKKATLKRNMQRPTVSKVVQRLDMAMTVPPPGPPCASLSASPQLDTLERVMVRNRRWNSGSWSCPPTDTAAAAAAAEGGTGK